MTIDEIVTAAERIVTGVDDSTRDDVVPGYRFFSYRHADEIHALGITREFSRDESRYLQVCASVVVSRLQSPMIWVRILWLRSKDVLPSEDCASWKFPLSEAGVRAFGADWASIRERMDRAVRRRRPPLAIAIRDRFVRRRAL